MNNEGLVVGVFDHQAPAERAVADLWAAGFARDRIDMVTRSQGQTQATPDLTRQKEAADGAVAGAMAGATAGAVAGAVAIMLIPGVGTVIGGGLLAGILGGAALGAAGGTFLGPFVALGVNQEEAQHYAREVDEGRVVVLVLAFDRAPEARAILARHGAREGPLNTAPTGEALAAPGRA
jgi:phage tail tape-measure protein